MNCSIIAVFPDPPIPTNEKTPGIFDSQNLRKVCNSVSRPTNRGAGGNEYTILGRSLVMLVNSPPPLPDHGGGCTMNCSCTPR